MQTHILKLKELTKRLRSVVRAYETQDNDLICDLMDIHDDLIRAIKAVEYLQRQRTLKTR